MFRSLCSSIARAPLRRRNVMTPLYATIYKPRFTFSTVTATPGGFQPPQHSTPSTEERRATYSQEVTAHTTTPDKVVSPPESSDFDRSEIGIPEPTSRQLFWYGVHCAVPMVGFGLMDNTIMIQAGDLIDTTIGVRFGFTTLAAAACGQVFSDASGVLFGGAVEAAAARMGLPHHMLTEEQCNGLRKVRFIRVFSSVVGVIIGCSLGMIQLWFMDLKKAERLKAQAQTRPLFSALMTEGHELLDCERCSLYLMLPDEGHSDELSDQVMWQAGIPELKKVPTSTELRRAFTSIDSDGDGVIRAREDLPRIMRRLGYGASMGATARKTDVESTIRDAIGEEAWQGDKITFEEFAKAFPALMQLLHSDSKFRVGDRPLIAEVLKPENQGQCLNIPDVDFYQTPGGASYYDSEQRAVDMYKGYRTKSLLLCPVMAKFGDEKRAIGVIEVANKHGTMRKSEREEPPSDKRSAVSVTNQHAIVRSKTRGWLDERFVAFSQTDINVVKALCMHAATTARQCGFFEEED